MRSLRKPDFRQAQRILRMPHSWQEHSNPNPVHPSSVRPIVHMKKKRETKGHRYQILRRVTALALAVLLILTSVFLYAPASADDAGNAAVTEAQQDIAGAAETEGGDAAEAQAEPAAENDENGGETALSAGISQDAGNGGDAQNAADGQANAAAEQNTTAAQQNAGNAENPQSSESRSAGSSASGETQQNAKSATANAAPQQSAAQAEDAVTAAAADPEDGEDLAGAAEPLDITNTSYVTGGTIEYRPQGNAGSWTSVAGASEIPVDADFRITVNFKDIPVADLMNTYGGAVTYTLPALFTGATIPNASVIDPDSREVIGTIIIVDDASGTQKMRIDYNQDFLQSHHGGKISQSSMSCEAKADRSKITSPDTTVKIGPADITISFESDPDSRLGTLTVEKGTPTFSQDANGNGYLNYSVTVKTGEAAMSAVSVRDSFTTNSKWVDSFVEGSYTDERGNAIASDNISVEGSNPGTLTWTVGDMAANSQKTLQYRVKLKDTYVGTELSGTKNRGSSTAVIGNTAVPYSKTNEHASDTSTFTPFTQIDASKSAGEAVDNGDTITIPYRIFIKASAENTWTVRNIKVNDSFGNYATGSRTDAQTLMNNAKYQDFHLYKGGESASAAVGDELTIDSSIGRGTGTNPYCYYSDTRWDPRFDLYIGDLPAGESRVITYNIVVNKAIFGTKNGAWRLRNSANLRTDDSSSMGSDGNQILVDGLTSDMNLGEKVWDRKTVGTRTEDAVTETATGNVYVDQDSSWTADADHAKTAEVPAGSYLYQVVVNEDGLWDVSNAVMEDTLGQYLQYAGFLRIDYYNGGLGSTASDSSAAVAGLQAKTPDQTWWLDIDGKTSFSVKTSELDAAYGGKRGAYLLTYYTSTVGMENISQTETSNTFNMSGSVIGPGGSATPITLTGATSRVTVNVTGGNRFSAAKYGWYYNSQSRTAYWVIEAEGTAVISGTVFKDEPQNSTSNRSFGQTTDTELLGVYKGTLSGDGHLNENFGTLSEFTNTGTLTALTEGTDYTFSKSFTKTDKTTLSGNFISINRTQTLSSGEKLYIILTTTRTGSSASKRDWVNLTNKLLVKESGLNEFVDTDSATLSTISGGTNFKEARSAAVRDESGSWTVKNGQLSHFLRDRISEPGLYTEWRVKVNYASDEKGRVQVTDHIPEGMEPVYVRFFWIETGSSYGTIADPPTMPELDLGSGWTEIGLKNAPMDGGAASYRMDATAYYNSQTRELRFDVANLKNKAAEAGVNAEAALDHYSLEVQIVTRVTDTEALTGTSKSFVNSVDIYDEYGELLTHDTATHTVSQTGLTKSKSSVNGGKVTFTITVNPLGTDMIEGADTLNVIDEMGTSLKFDPDSVKAVDKDGNAVTIGVSDGGTENNVKKTIFTVPDSRKVVITYDGIVMAGQNETYDITNKAYLEGYPRNPAESNQSNMTNNVGGTSGAASHPTIQVIKRDAADNTVKLSGAEFEVQKVVWDSGTNGWSVEGSPLSASTDTSGEVSFGGEQSTNGALAFNTVYRVTETEAPDGYLLDQTPAYICIANGSASQEDRNSWKEHGVSVQVYGELSSTYIHNAYDQAEEGRILVSKAFQDSEGNAATGENIPDGTYSFGLYQNDTLLRTLHIIYRSGTASYRISRLVNGSEIREAVTEPVFAGLKVREQYSVYELDADGNPVKSSGTRVRLNRTTFEVQYSGNNTVTASAAQDKTISIVNKAEREVTPDTNGPSGRNRMYLWMLLAAISAFGAFAVYERKHMR